MWIALCLKGSLQNIFSPAPAITEQGFLCSGAPLCTQPGTAMVSAWGLRRGGTGSLLTSLMWHETVLHRLHTPPGGYFHCLKNTFHSRSKILIHTCICLQVTAICFCADSELDIWISQLLCACAKGTPNNLEYTHEPILSSFTFHLIHTDFYCNLLGFWSVCSIWLN